LTHFVPEGDFHQIRSHLRIGTHPLATKAIAIHPYTSIIGIRSRAMFAGTGTKLDFIHW
jgi:hypothetical protein